MMRAITKVGSLSDWLYRQVFNVHIKTAQQRTVMQQYSD